MRRITKKGGHNIRGRLVTYTGRPFLTPQVLKEEGEGMPKKRVRVIITGSLRRKIEVDAIVQIVIALGREFAARKNIELASKPTHAKVASS